MANALRAARGRLDEGQETFARAMGVHASIIKHGERPTNHLPGGTSVSGWWLLRAIQTADPPHARAALWILKEVYPL